MDWCWNEYCLYSCFVFYTGGKYLKVFFERELFRCVIKIFMAVLLGENYLSCFVGFLSLTLSYYLFRGEKTYFI